MTAKPFLIGGVILAGAWFYFGRETISESPADQFAGDVFQGVITMKKVITGWTPAIVPEQYRAIIGETEAARGIPPGMLARLLYQESHYRPDIISGATRSKVGALGIAQFMPATAADLNIDPLDPTQAIPAAGQYLASLYRSTGNWRLALAAYNWGIGNVKRKGIDAAPAETVKYVSDIMSDISYA